MQASEALEWDDLRISAASMADAVLESIRRDGWVCGVPDGVETPGLMTGIAGIGYGLLRTAAPARVPSVLILEPPRLSN